MKRTVLLSVGAAIIVALCCDAAEGSQGFPKECWRGFNLLGMFRAPGDLSDPRAQGFREEPFKWIGEWGFNFVRLPMDYRHFAATNDYSQLREEGFVQLDRAIAWGRKHGLHVQICLHRAPGFTVLSWDPEPLKLQTDPRAQQAFCGLWRVFAKRYRGIPSAVLSFNLLNEPCGFSTAQYVSVFSAAVKAIRAEDPDRFIMLDGNNTASTPVKEFVTVNGTGQAFRGYVPHAISHYGAWFVKPQPPHEPSWPPKPGEVNPKLRIWRMPATECDKFESLRASGYPVMIGEFGCYNRISHATALAWMEDCLKLWRDRNLGWALWNLDGPFGILDSERKDVVYEDFEGHKLDRKMLDLLRRFAVPNSADTP